MADGTPAFELPPGTVPIVRSLTAAGDLFTFPSTAQRLIVLSAWISFLNPGAPTSGTAVIDCFPEFDSAVRVICGLNLPATANLSQSSSTACVIPIRLLGNSGAASNDRIRLTITGLTLGTVNGGFTGYLESA